MCARVIHVEAQCDIDQRDHADGDHRPCVGIGGAARLCALFGRAQPVPEAGQSRENRHRGSSDDDIGAGAEEVTSEGFLAADRRDDVEYRRHHVRRHRKIGQRRMRRLARPTPQSLERSALQRQRGAD